MVASRAMHEMSEAELRAVIADCVEALEEGADNPADQLVLMVSRDHARFLLRKLSAEAAADV